MAAKGNMFEKIVLFCAFLIFAAIIVFFAVDYNSVDENNASSGTVSLQYLTTSKAPYQSQISEANSSVTSSKAQIAVVNINTATKAELDTLPGIGPSKAEAIITYRETVGRFNTIEDIKNVKGIGDKTFQNLKDYITVK